MATCYRLKSTVKKCGRAVAIEGSFYLFGSACSCLLAHPVPSLGTSETLGSLPLFSAFRLGRLAGGGIRRAEATLPRDCRPWRGGTDDGKMEAISTVLQLKQDTD